MGCYCRIQSRERCTTIAQKVGNISPLLKNHQNVIAVLLLDYEHPIAKATRAAVKKEINKKPKKKQINQNNELVPIRIPGGGKCYDMWTMGRKRNHFD